METKISEIRKEYIKGKLTQCTINDNPFEQFEEWLNDAIAHNADEAHRHDSSNCLGRGTSFYTHRLAERSGKQQIYILY